jgi:molecular chaperone DnaK
MIWSVTDKLNARLHATTGTDVYAASDGPTAALGLRHAVAVAMGELRHALQTTVIIDHGGGFAHDVVTPLYRTDIASWLAPDFARIRTLCERVLNSAGMTAQAIDAVLLVGDATDLPGLRELVAEAFARPVADLVAENAPNLPVLGATLAQTGGVMWDVTPYALGINCIYGERELFSPIIRPNTQIPTPQVQERNAHTERYQTLHPNQKEVSLAVLQYRGKENPDPYGATPVLPHECEQLGVWTFRGLRPKRGQRASFTVSFAVDEDGILHLLAKETATGHMLSLQVDRRIG